MNTTVKNTSAALCALLPLIVASAGCSAAAPGGSERTATSKQAITTDGQGFAAVIGAGSLLSSFNSTGGAVSVAHPTTGLYGVTFTGLGSNNYTLGGNAQVASQGWSAERCELVSWASTGSAVVINVFCVDTTNAPADSSFDVTFVQGYGEPQTAWGAYVWDNVTSNPGTSTPDTYYQWSSAGTPATSTRLGVGYYELAFPNLGMPGGNLQVTSYEGWSADGAYCKTPWWGQSGTNEYAYVLCFDHSGNAADVNFTAHLIFGDADASDDIFDYAFANQSGSTSYTPADTFSNGGYSDITAGWLGTGQYRVNFPGTYYPPYGQSLMVTAVGWDAGYCKLAGFGDSGTTWSDYFLCFLPNGALENSEFSVLQLTNVYIP